MAPQSFTLDAWRQSIVAPI